MKAVRVTRFGPLDAARFRTVEDPAPGPGEVVVAARAVDVNYPDLLVVTGAYQVKPPLPFSPGKAAAGVVERVGEGVTALCPGDRVAVQVEYGAYAEKIVAPVEASYPMPEAMGFDVAAALGLAYQTAYFALTDRGRVERGDHVLILGATGAVGDAAIQLAKAFGAGSVVAGVRGVGKAAIAMAAGADATVDLGMGGVRDGLRDAVRRLTGGHGADVVIDPVGGDITAAALRAMAWRGRMVIVGFAHGDIPVIRSNYLLVKNITVSGLQWSDYRDRAPAWVAQAQREIFDLWRVGRIAPRIGGRFALADFAHALAQIRDGTAAGKLILSIDTRAGQG